MIKILICEDNQVNLKLLSTIVKRMGYTPIECTDGHSCLNKLESDIDLVLLDLNLPDINGLDILIGIKNLHQNIKVIMVTRENSDEFIKKAYKLGASNYIVKPFNEEKIKAAIEEILTPTYEQKKIFLKSKNVKLQNIYNQASIVAKSNANIIIQGESGSGKEVFAKLLHNQSDRSNKPFIAINCAAIPHNLVESELFGHIKGAFTGAESNRIGKFADADGGTIFLDEVSDLPYEIQVKLLRVIQEKVLEPVGSNKPTFLNVRFICASNKDLREEVAHKRFRLDLYYRVAEFVFTLPQLAERKEDILDLANLFIEQFCIESKRPILTLSSHSQIQLKDHSWPGNIRELQSLVRRVIILTPNNIPQIDSIPGQYLSNTSQSEEFMPEIFDKKNLKKIEKEMIEKTLFECKFNLSAASKILGIGRTTLYRKLQLYKIEYRKPKVTIDCDHKNYPKTNILVVDDNDLNRELMRKIIEKEGFNVILANNGYEAIEQSFTTKFHLILMDIRMPGIDGYETTKMIKRGDSPNKSTPIFAVTTNVEREDCEQARKSQMGAIIAKPITIKSIRKALQHLNNYDKEFIHINIDFPEREKIDYSILSEIASMADEDNPNFFAEQVDRFINYNRNLREKLQLAVNQKKRNSIEYIAHSMAGSAANFGAKSLANVCILLEKNAYDYSSNEINDSISSITDESEYFYNFLNDERFKRAG